MNAVTGAYAWTQRRDIGSCIMLTDYERERQHLPVISCQ